MSKINPVVAKNVSDKQASPSIANGIRFIERCLEDLIISGIYTTRKEEILLNQVAALGKKRFSVLHYATTGQTLTMVK